MTKTRKKDPNALATITFLPKAAIIRNIPDAIWFMHRMIKSCLKNLNHIDFFNASFSRNTITNGFVLFIPFKTRIIADDVVGHEDPDGRFGNGDRDFEDPRG